MKLITVIAPKEFRAEELAAPKEALEAAGHEVTVASTVRGECTSVPAGSVRATLSLREVDPQRFDGIVFVGGPGAKVLFDDPEAHRLAREFTARRKLVGAICIAPTILARAGVVKGKHATCYLSETRELSAAGALADAFPVVTDGLLVTAKGPAQAASFGAALVSVLQHLVPVGARSAASSARVT